VWKLSNQKQYGIYSINVKDITIIGIQDKIQSVILYLFLNLTRMHSILKKVLLSQIALAFPIFCSYTLLLCYFSFLFLFGFFPFIFLLKKWQLPSEISFNDVIETAYTQTIALLFIYLCV